MYSGNYYEINKKMTECVQLLVEALQSSDKYSNALQFANRVKNNTDLKDFITNTDLSTKEGKEKLNKFLTENPDLQYSGNNLKVTVPIFWGAAAVVYVAAAVVSIAAVLYSVYYKAAYWSLEEFSANKLSENSITKEVAIREIANNFKSNE